MPEENANKTVTRADLAETVYKIGVKSRAKAADMVDCVLDEISNAILRDGKLKLGSFGSFTVHHKTPRVGRNPKTMEDAIISARSVLKFKASDKLRARLNPRQPEPEPEIAKPWKKRANTSPSAPVTKAAPTNTAPPAKPAPAMPTGGDMKPARASAKDKA